VVTLVNENLFYPLHFVGSERVPGNGGNAYRYL
jgi:hypothetical protein